MSGAKAGRVARKAARPAFFTISPFALIDLLSFYQFESERILVLLIRRLIRTLLLAPLLLVKLRKESVRRDLRVNKRQVHSIRAPNCLGVNLSAPANEDLALVPFARKVDGVFDGMGDVAASGLVI